MITVMDFGDILSDVISLVKQIYTSFTYNRGSLLRVTIFLFAYRQKNNKLPMSVDRHLEECYIKYRQKHIIIANVRE